MDDSLNARFHFDANGNIVADTRQGQILIVRRDQRKNAFESAPAGNGVTAPAPAPAVFPASHPRCEPQGNGPA